MLDWIRTHAASGGPAGPPAPPADTGPELSDDDLQVVVGGLERVYWDHSSAPPLSNVV